MEYYPSNNEFIGIIRSSAVLGTPKIEATANGVLNQRFPIESLFDFSNKSDVDSPHLAVGNTDTTNASVNFHLINNVIILSNYTIRSHITNDNFLYNWQLFGSNNNKDWTLLHGKGESDDLINGNTKTYDINNDKPFSCLRIEMNGTTKNNNPTLRILNIDFYGLIFRNYHIQTCDKTNGIILSKLLYTSTYLLIL